MKRAFKSIACLIFMLSVLFSMASCSTPETGETSSGGDSNAVDDDFFVDNETPISGQEEQTGSTSQGTANSSNAPENSTAGTTSVPKENQIGGKSWEQVLASMPSKLKGTTVTMYNWNPASEYTGAPTVIQEFEEETGIKVEWNTVNFDVYVSRLASLIASGESPDLVRTRTPVPERLVSFQPLSAANFDFTDEAWDQVLMEDYTVNGVTYATSLKNTHLGSVGMLFYNKELIDKYDLENPYTLWKNGEWTTSKFLEMCEDYKKDSNADFACTGMLYDTWSQLYGIPGPVGYDGSKYYSLVQDSKFLTVTQEVADLFNTSKLFGEGRAEVFNAGDSLFYAGASVYARKKNSYFGSLKSAGSFYAVPFPQVDGQSTYYQIRDEYEAYAIAKGAKNPEAVPYFLRYFLDGSNYELDGFFCNKQNLEVYNWCMSQENTIWTTYYDSTEDPFGDRGTGIYSLQGNQIKSFIDSNAAVIDQRVKKYNDMLKNLA